MRQYCNCIPLVLIVLLATVSAFVPPSFRQQHQLSPPQHQQYSASPVVPRQRQSVAAIQLHGMFGLGAPEIAVILVAAAFLLGPQKLAELGKDAGRVRAFFLSPSIGECGNIGE